MSSNSGPGGIVAVLFFFVGFYLFLKGFATYRRYRLLADMPKAKARSAPMGLVEIEGVTKRADEFIDAPVSGIPCLGYKVEVEAEKADKDGRASWSTIARDFRGVKFFLEDVSGEILVDPTGAELDLEIITQRTTSAKRQDGRSETEYSKVNTGPGAQPFVPDETLNQYAGAFLARRRRLPSGLETPRDMLQWILFKVGITSRYTGAFRFKEYCLRPGISYVIAGTCAENPQARDERERALLTKGKNNPLFVISQGSEKKRERGLRAMAGCSVVGGAVMALFALAYLLHELGLFSGALRR